MNQNNQNVKKSMFPYIMLLVIGLSIMFFYNFANDTTKKLTYNQFNKALNNNKVTEVVITPSTSAYTYEIEGKYKKGKKTYSFRVKTPLTDSVIDKIVEASEEKDFKIVSKSDPSASTWFIFLVNVAPYMLLIGVAFWFFTRQLNGQKGSMDFGRSKAKLNPDNGKVTFKDVAGLPEEKEELQELIDFLKSPKKFTKLGARIPKGVLLVGPPGTGKTLLAKAVAGEAGVPFFIISGSDFVEMFVGVGASRVRDLFEQAKKNAPCIIFIDEIDAVGRQRGAGLGGGHDEREQTLNQLLVEMDGFATNEGVIVLAATNRPDILDKALLRPGRFDRQIVVSAPDVKAREQILEVHSRKKKIGDDVDLKTIAKNTAGFAGADLENVLNEAALLAARRDKKEINMQEIEEAMIKVTVGPEKKSRVRNEKENKLVAFHEAGHAVVSRFLPTQDTVHQISIVPRGMAGGYTLYKPDEDKNFISKTAMEENIISLLGGRVAEELVIGDISTGASNDIERATKIARSMVTKYGMSEKVGTIAFGSGQEEVFLGRDLAQAKDFSEETANLIDQEVKRIIDTAYARAREILNNNMDKLTNVATRLLEKEKIDGEEFEEIFNS